MGTPAKYEGIGIRFLTGVKTWILRDEAVFDGLQLVLQGGWEGKHHVLYLDVKFSPKATGVKDSGPALGRLDLSDAIGPRARGGLAH